MITLKQTKRCIGFLIVAGFLIQCKQNKEMPLPPGDPDNGGLILPEGFEAVVVVDSIGSARHLAVNDNGDIYIKMRYAHPEGENIGLRDTDNNGKADIIKRFGVYDQKGWYGTGMRIYNDYLYFSTAGEVYRQKITPDKLVPEAKTELILTDDFKNALYGYSHIAKPITFDNDGHIYIPFGSPSDVCQPGDLDRKPGALGQYPCPELEWHAGVWQFDANRTNQLQKDGKRYATGIRSIVGMDWNDTDNTLYALQHGRDNMNRNWPDIYSPWQSAMLPAEEFLRVKEGSDAGWPYYYYDQIQGKKVLNPEYGGDGIKEGNGAENVQPIIGFPGHWAPNDLHFYKGDQFPKHYKNGAFIAFHGSTIRSPFPQSGYFVGFVPFKNGKAGDWEVFADGFVQVDKIVDTDEAGYRPMGIAMGPDGSLYISESEHGKIWRVMYKGDKKSFGPEQLAQMEKRKKQPHIRTPNETTDDLTPMRVESGAILYNKYCGSCHMSSGQGDGIRFPPIAGSKWVKGDQKNLINVVLNGLQGPIEVNGKPFDGIMPPMDYLEDKEIAEILTYVRKEFGDNATPVSSFSIKSGRYYAKKAKEDIN
ncbi:PQQ-dependent sugar dehydrogenase [Maribacter sp. HTCC2170]|uniref:PQQ-dependent sugar dehydrogenase n=1 Tax=Maribacter sp. (strain HTCC2170 / KCCM 42371) TaxID=313603 RepID=UPI00006B4752|nr:c-type cytochrome [Maribacter sp. HTCC2170]EAR01860.1 L-sorbosone dehydrogenase [Maribacter sp. HTCC2170]